MLCMQIRRITHTAAAPRCGGAARLASAGPTRSESPSPSTQPSQYSLMTTKQVQAAKKEERKAAQEATRARKAAEAAQKAAAREKKAAEKRAAKEADAQEKEARKAAKKHDSIARGSQADKEVTMVVSAALEEHLDRRKESRAVLEALRAEDGGVPHVTEVGRVADIMTVAWRRLDLLAVRCPAQRALVLALSETYICDTN